MKLQEFIKQKEDIAKETVRCGGCQNIMLHAGKYEIITIADQEALLCQTCKKNKIEPASVSIISEDNNHVFNAKITDLDIQMESDARAMAQMAKESPIMDAENLGINLTTGAEIKDSKKSKPKPQDE